MHRCAITLAVVVAGTAGTGAACAPQDLPSTEGNSAAWVGTITTEGGVTTVRNESGSVWGGKAELIEEASIGVDIGEPEYMLGDIRAVTANDEHIYVADVSVPVVRVYDHEGRYVREVGSQGSGPGEFLRPDKAVVAADGTLYVYGDGRVNVYSPSGESIDTWQFPRPSFGSSSPIVLTSDGTLYLHDRLRGSGGLADRRDGMRALGPEGPAEEMVLVPDLPAESYALVNEIVTGTRRMTARTTVPFGPRLVWSMTHEGTIVAGVSSDYRFEVHGADGLQRTVEKAWTPVPVGADRAAWNRQRQIESFRRQNPEWQWNGPPIPRNMPAYTALYAGSNGRIWVQRTVASERLENCDPTEVDPDTERPRNCWQSRQEFDIFDADGRFLTWVDYPPRTLRHLTIRGEQVIAYVEDEAGIGMVKRYRLVPPASGE